LRTADDGGVLLLDRHLLGTTEHIESHILQLGANVLGDEGPRGEDRDILKHRLAPIAEAGRLNRRHLEAAAQFVDDEGGKRLAFHVFRDNQ
jgi:hypothetical protein